MRAGVLEEPLGEGGGGSAVWGGGGGMRERERERGGERERGRDGREVDESLVARGEFFFCFWGFLLGRCRLDGEAGALCLEASTPVKLRSKALASA
jgi:hypothetical protein